jgi:DnaJ-class molecular chaperone
MKNLYKILGVPEDADDGALKKAFRRLAKEYHPDATGGDKRKTERFKEVNEAYAVLGDRQKRAEYDRLRRAPVGNDGFPQGFDPETFAQVFGGRGPFGAGTRVRVQTQGGNVGDVGDLGDLFESLFGGGPNPFARGGRRAPSRGADLAGVLELGFREAALGTRKTIRGGSGAPVEVQVPPGVDAGGKLRVPGQGGPAPRGGQPGDLHLEVRVLGDPILRRSGPDVEMDLPLTLGEAVLGTQVDVPTVDGTVRLSVPAGTSSGAKLRLRGKGARRPDGTRGDQICRVQIVVPRLEPDDAEGRRLVEELERRRGPGKVRDF